MAPPLMTVDMTSPARADPALLAPPGIHSAILAGGWLEVFLFVSVPFFPISHRDLNEGRDPV